MKQQDGRPVLKQLLWPVSALFMALALTVSVYAGPAQADETASDDVDTEDSYFSNPAQAAHAAQLSSEVAADDPDVKEAYDDYQEALDAYNALETPTQTDLEALEAIEATYEATLAEKIGVATGEIASMRASGMGWGDIAHELGVHPSLLGLGHTKGKTNRHGVEKEYTSSLANDELAEATVRTTGRGLALGHGRGINNSDETTETSLALASVSTKSNKGRSSVSGAAGLGSGKSNGSGNSKAGGNSSNSGNSGKSGNAGKSNNSSSNSNGKGNSGGSNKGGNSDKGNNGGGHGNGNGKK